MCLQGNFGVFCSNESRANFNPRQAKPFFNRLFCTCCFFLILFALSFFAVPSIGYAVDKMCRQVLTLRTRQMILSYRLAGKKTKPRTPTKAISIFYLPFCTLCLATKGFTVHAKEHVPTPIGNKKRCASYLRFYRSTVLPFYRSTVLRFYRSTVLPFYRFTVLRFSASATIP